MYMYSNIITDCKYLGDVDSRPEELEMFSHLGRLVLGVEYGQFGEHAHVCPLQAEGRLEEGDQLVEEAKVLVVVDEFLKFVSVDHNVETTDLSETEFLRVHTSKTDLYIHGRGGGRKRYEKCTEIDTALESMYR
jgi:hypothetical protein